ncbi:uncharacterized protein DUF4148 [Paraburkholderia sp. BL6665CI2N2]|uniref:DUF4148 domain-containing protein n=1 Tax=Paraburkholderia sp. BL6665CI2N2 TaxID=1938806 RepID=UPI0010D6047E|nr:DUF4148 domain-containing protein [Paraburkholderia sp. BL6665CI2N2]TDY21709.1 uncharacterized protein DUF4148 [Paraburkholderia sp. BL6665CI2N2]
MYSEPRKIVLAGLVVSAVAIAAYVSQAGKPWQSTDEFGSARGETPAYRTRGDTISGAVISGPVAARNDSSGASASGLQAARNSLQRNDLAAAQAQLDAVRSAHQDDDQVRALQKEVQARVDNEQRAVNTPQVEKAPQRAAKPVRMSSSSAKHGRSRESRAAVRKQTNPETNRETSYAKNQAALDSLVARVDSHSAPDARTPVNGEPAVARQPSSVQAGLKAMQSASSVPGVVTPLVQQVPQKPPVVSTAPTESQAGLATQATLPSPPLVQAIPSAGTAAKTDDGPKTRSQVRAEIARARENGSLPAFGNPDPAGPGGAPSLTAAPRP